MAGLNKVMVIGNLGKDPEMRYAQNGTAICNMTVATSEEWTDKNSGQKQEKTEWHRITVFGKMGENCGKYLAKGSKVFVDGKLSTSEYEKDGIKKYSTSIIASSVQFLSSKPAGGDQSYQHPGGFQGNVPPPVSPDIDDPIPF